MKRLVHITSSLQLGGAEHVLVTLIEQLPHYDHQVIYFHDGPLRSTLAARGIKTYHIKGAFTLYDPWFLVRLYRMVKQLQPAALHSLLWAANFCARSIAYWLNIPLICAIHARAEHEGDIRKRLDVLLPFQPQYYVAVAPSIANSLRAQRTLNPARIKTIPNGIALRQEYPATKKDSRLFVIGAVGRLVPVKNFAFLITTFAQFYQQHPQARLLIVGGGPLEGDLKKIVKDYMLASAVTFMGIVTAHDYYPQFDCFVQPSHSEGLSLALLEALSYNLPVIVTGNNQQHDVIEHTKTGFIIDHDNVDQLINCWKQLLHDQQLRTQLGQAGLALVQEKYTAAAMAQQYDTLFRMVTDHHQHLL